jgi:hypothetical protein
MKTKTSLLILVTLLLASCAPASTPTPTETATVAPTATNTLLPTETFTPAPTATITPVVIPDYMNQFIEKGYKTLSGNGILYVVNQEGKSGYADGDGIMFNGIRIYSWMTGISYFDEQGIFHNDGIILDGVCREMRPQDFWAILVDSTNTISHSSCPSVAFFKSTRTEISRKSIGDNFIFKGSVGVATGNGTKDINKIFEGYFPIVDGKYQSVTIPSIGSVLPIVRMDYESKVEWTQ